ncbi:cation diffusion facilitator family transporter [Megasphaera vaginalis (ex Bordigoni et al. 2020)]|uniref:cation diffusion facilitator family transporter n=1 Tax=Megasphaera vaginalis (ex Bordigoni et al. 2020) TaxID=2045301 RepID=UPI001F3FA4D9|nr:cation diffusion facilitator family transporter [Megasphaera vaginalis (ex Bordigoni et al. 2020)]
MTATNMEDIKKRTARLSVMSTLFLTAGKLCIGIMTGTVSLISEAIHSGIDLLAAALSLLAVRAAAVPPDAEHEYGHGKIETVSAAFESLLIIVAALAILREAAEKFWSPAMPEHMTWAIAAMAVSVILNGVVSHRLCNVGKATRSEALLADGMHLRADVWTSLAVLIGIVLIQLTGWPWLDPVIAVFVALAILRVGYKMCRRSFMTLTDASLPQEKEEEIGRLIMETEGVKGFHNLRTRTVGKTLLMDLHLEIDQSLPLHTAHAISDNVEHKLKQTYAPCDLTIHLDPA